MSLVTLNPPKEFTFEISNPSSAKTVFKIQNNSKENLAFKIKTTAPKYYVVRPNTGIIKGNKEIEVSIHLQPIPSSVKDHKFMLQVAMTSLSTDNLQADTLANFWKNIKNLSSSVKEDHKLKVTLVSSNVYSNPTAVEEKKVEVIEKVSGEASSSPPVNIRTEVEEAKEPNQKKNEFMEKISTLEK